LKESEGEDHLVENLDVLEQILTDLLRGFHAKDKNVRYRALQLVGIVMKYTNEMRYLRFG
jgi:hypothetical protein